MVCYKGRDLTNNTGGCCKSSISACYCIIMQQMLEQGFPIHGNKQNCSSRKEGSFCLPIRLASGQLGKFLFQVCFQ